MISRTQRNLPPLRMVPRPKLIGADYLVLAKTKPAVFYCQMLQAELENSMFSQMNSLFDRTNSLFRRRTGKSCATHWDCSTNRDREWTEVTKMVRNFENSLLISLECTPCVRHENWEQVNQHIQQRYAGVEE